MEKNDHSDLRKHIHFILGEEARPKIETFGNDGIDIEKSIFYKQYRMALSYVADFIDITVNTDKSDQSDGIQFSHKQNYNNILLFTGERGSGKTSCLLTISELLTKHVKDLVSFFNLEKVKDDPFAGKVKTLKEMEFFPCEIIDPTFFDQRNNILEVFIGGLFKRFKMLKEERRKRNGENGFRGNTRNGSLMESELLHVFKDVQAHLKTLTREQTDDGFEDDLDDLYKLTAAVDFKKCIDKLLNTFLQYESGTADIGNKKLLLCVDDIDLNMANAYVMVEQIRKYLCHPSLIIFMAVKIGQLSNVIKINYFDDFAPMLKQQDKQHPYKENYKEVIDQIVERYMTKLFPLNQRIYLPDTSHLFDKEICIYKRKADGVLERVDEGGDTVFRNELLHLIYRKIRMLFYNTSKQTSYIIPRNLRELRHLVRLLYNMKDAPGNEEAVENLVLFKQYFDDMWCANNLDEGSRYVMRHIWNIEDANVLNKTVVQLLKQRFEMEEILKDNPDAEISQILKSGNVMYNVSLGDVLACLDWLDKICYEKNEMRLIFAIKTFYSMRLYEGFRYKKEQVVENEKRRKEVINKELLTRNETAYGDIVNGGLLNSEYLNVLPFEGGKVSRNRRVINAELLSDLIDYIAKPNDSKLKEKLKSNESFKNINVDVLLSKKSNLQKIVEFFMLTTSFIIDSKDVTDGNSKTFTDNHRTKRSVFYESSIHPNRKYACFDLLYIFYSLSNVETAYKRYDAYSKDNLGWHSKEGNGLYQSILSGVNLQNFKSDYYKVLIEYDNFELKDENDRLGTDKFSIRQLCQKLKRCQQETVQKNNPKKSLYERVKEGKEDETIQESLLKCLNILERYELRYKLNIRNIEILEQISYLLQRSRPDGNSDNVKVLQSVFGQLGNYKIVTYKNEEIDFEFFKKISEFFLDLDKDENKDFKGIFNYIYTLPEATLNDGNKS